MTRPARASEFWPAREHAPAALAALDAAYASASAAIDPELAEAVRRRVTDLLDPTAERQEEARAAPAALLPCLAFVDQFVVYVPGVTAAQCDDVAAALGPERLHELARMLYVFDLSERLRLSFGHLFGPLEGPGAPPVAPARAKPLDAALTDSHAAAMQLHALDPVTTELVRLHCANYHDCKT